MINYVTIGGEQRPVAFGHKVAYDYEINTGKNYNALLVAVSEMFFASAAAVSGADGAADMDIDEIAIHLSEDRKKAVEQFSVVPLTDIVYYGMLYAHRREGIEVDFEPSDVAEWIFGDQAAMNACMRLLMESLPANKDAQKKTQPVAKPNRALRARPKPSA